MRYLGRVWSHSSVYALISPLFTRFWVKIHSIILFTRFSIYVVFPGKQKTRKQRRECTETKMHILEQGKNCNRQNRTVYFLLLLKEVLLRTIAMLFCMPYSTFCVTITNNMKVILMGNLSFIVLFL